MLGRILYVEDNPLNMNLMKKMLKVMDYELIAAVDGSTGIMMAQYEQPRLILMDLFLPDMNGWEVTKRLKGNPITAHIPVVALTSDISQIGYDRFVQAGCDGYLNKPVSRVMLLKTIQQFALVRA
jgi:two-component system, cell cycle response regulator DivK